MKKIKNTNHMKSLLKSIALVLLTIFTFSCVEEKGDEPTEGQIELQLLTPIALNDTLDYSVRIKLYREYTDQTQTITLAVNEFTDTAITTEAYTIEYGYWELQQANIILNGNPYMVAIDEEDDRAGDVEDEMLLPLYDNVLLGQKTVFTMQAVYVIEPVEGLPYYSYDFEDDVDYAHVGDGWTTVDVNEGDRGWISRSYGGNGYAQASAHTGSADEYKSWLITPPLDFDQAAEKVISFLTAQAYWKETSELKVYVMSSINPSSAELTELDVRTAQSSDNDYEMIPSGDIDLSSVEGVKYIGFYYKGEGGSSNSTTFQLDDFLFGEASGIHAPDDGEGGGGQNGGTVDNPYTVEEAMLESNQTGAEAWVQGYIVGYVVYDPDQNHTVTRDWNEATDTNVAIALSPDETEKTNMLFVQLSGAGSDARTNLGLNSTQGASLGNEVKFNGTLEAYFGVAGLKGVQNAEDYEIINQ